MREGAGVCRAGEARRLTGSLVVTTIAFVFVACGSYVTATSPPTAALGSSMASAGVSSAGVAPQQEVPTNQPPGVNRSALSISALNYAYLRRAWEIAARSELHSGSSMTWSEASQRWVGTSRSASAQSNDAQAAYNLEPVMRAGINIGVACGDPRVLNELSQFYVMYSQRFVTLRGMRETGGAAGLQTSLLANQGPDSAKTLEWVEKLKSGGRIRECTLCNSQFFHPAGHLIRVIAQMPTSQRTPEMIQFVRVYAPIIVSDHLIRLLYEADWNYWGDTDLPKKLVPIWQAIMASKTPPRFSYQHAMSDIDLWIIATAAEMLGANASDPSLVPLTADEKAKLRNAVGVGVRLFVSKRTLYPNTKNFQGTVVGSASYFNGEYDDQVENAYARYTGARFPTPANKTPHPDVSWDISHAYRIPVFLRSLYDNRAATGVIFPSADDMRLVTNQFMYRVFQGDFSRPLFNNFFDGANGWFRVGYARPDFGYPPAQYCDADNPNRPCLVIGTLQGWGLLVSFNPDLERLQSALVELAREQNASAFKQRYYFYGGQAYSPIGSSGNLQYPLALFEVIADDPALAGCGSR